MIELMGALTLSAKILLPDDPRPTRPGARLSPYALTSDEVCLTYGTPEWFMDAVQQLADLAKLPADWNGEGGKPLQPSVRDFALSVLGWLRYGEAPTPTVVLGPKGTVQLEWRASGRELELEILRPGRIGFLKVYPDGEMEEMELTEELPRHVQELVQWVLHG